MNELSTVFSHFFCLVMLPVDPVPPHGYSSASHRQLALLIRDFARFIDSRQWHLLRQLLAPAVSLGNPTEPSEVVLSSDDFINRWQRWQLDLGATQHSLAVRHIAVFGTEATGFVDAFITSCSEQEVVVQWGGQFNFVFCQQANHWLIGKLDIIPLWITESPQASTVLARLKQLLAVTSP